MGKRKSRPDVKTDDWLGTYGDMVTLLLCFFVLLYSISSVDMNKLKLIAEAFSNQKPTKIVQGQDIPEFGAGGNPEDKPIAAPPKTAEEKEAAKKAAEEAAKAAAAKAAAEKAAALAASKDFDSLYQKMKKYIKENKLEQDIGLYKGDGYTFIMFRNNIFFDGDQYALKKEGAKVLDALCGGVQPINELISQIRILGHTTQADPNRPNDILADRFLSSNRATNVLVYMQKKNVVSSTKLISEGYGQFHPISPVDTETSRMKNRRVEILITKNDTVNVTLDKVYQVVKKAEQ